jgi:CsoR family transcriptional regulator, copper-sensing transcriptional repressor
MDEKSCCNIATEIEDGERRTDRSLKLKKSLITRLNRVEGQIRGIRKMIENDTYCDDVLNQISAATAALNGISKLVLENHIRTCVVEKINQDDMIIEELIQTIDKMLK